MARPIVLYDINASHHACSLGDRLPVHTTMDPVTVVVGFVSIIFVYKVYRHHTGISLANIPGPECASLIMGNMKELFQGLAGEADFKWHAQYGDVVRIKGPLGQNQLIVSDPAALQHILINRVDRFPRPPERRVISKMLFGKGIGWATGEDHKRQRKIMLPGFGWAECRAFFPIFMHCAETICNKWMDMTSNSTEQSTVINILPWISRASLDSIGQAAFNIHFESNDSHLSNLARAYTGMMADAFGYPSDGMLFFHGISKYIPYRILEYFSDRSKSPRVMRLNEVGILAKSVAKGLVESKAEMLLRGKGNRDVFSLLIKANMDAYAKEKLTDEELYTQMRTILFAGHESTAGTVSWSLFELAKHPEVQSRLRTEIREIETTMLARGDIELKITDIDNMPYLDAVTKEVLRFCPVGYHMHRCADQDDVVPLSKPITTLSGGIIDELPIPKGTRIVISVAAYNRNKDLWGEDAHEFNPERWLDGTVAEKQAMPVGVYSNILTFMGGPKSCIGWRFAVVEFQAFLVKIIGQFEFALTEKSERIRHESGMVMFPTVEGEAEKGVQLPLRVSVAPRIEKRD